MPHRAGLLLRMLHTKTDRTAAREDLVDRIGKPPSHDNMRQLTNSLRKAFKTITTEGAESDAAFQVNYRAASVTLDTQFVHTIWKDYNPSRERNVVTSFDESYEAGALAHARSCAHRYREKEGGKMCSFTRWLTTTN